MNQRTYVEMLRDPDSIIEWFDGGGVDLDPDVVKQQEELADKLEALTQEDVEFLDSITGTDGREQYAEGLARRIEALLPPEEPEP